METGVKYSRHQDERGRLESIEVNGDSAQILRHQVERGRLESIEVNGDRCQIFKASS